MIIWKTVQSLMAIVGDSQDLLLLFLDLWPTTFLGILQEFGSVSWVISKKFEITYIRKARRLAQYSLLRTAIRCGYFQGSKTRTTYTYERIFFSNTVFLKLRTTKNYSGMQTWQNYMLVLILIISYSKKIWIQLVSE